MMFDKNRVADDFSVAAHHYAQHATLQRKIGEGLIAKTAAHIPAGAMLLDVGAGSGELTKCWPVARRVALDVSVGMCEEAQAKGIPSVNASAVQLPLRSGSFDLVASNLMLQWIPDVEQFFSESFRVLKAGGIIAISHFSQGTLTELEQAFAAAGQEARVSRFHAPSAIMQKVQQAGFEIISEQQETLEERYHGVMELCHFIRDIGAANKRADRPRGLLTPRALRRVTAAYPREGLYITASWVVHTILARKAS